MITPAPDPIPAETRIGHVHLKVADLERAVAFYRDGLGLPTDGIIGQEFDEGAVAFFQLQGIKLGLWRRRDLARDSGLDQQPASPTEFSIGHNVNSREEVDSVMQEAERGGANIIKPASETFWGGYAGYFADPDGHLWEVVWNPEWTVEDRGT